MLVSEIAYGPQLKVLGWSPWAQKLVLCMEEEVRILRSVRRSSQKNSFRGECSGFRGEYSLEARFHMVHAAAL